MTRRYGRAPRGQRLVAAVPHGHWKTSTFVAGLRTSGLTAPLVVDGAMNGDIFRAYVEQVLAPTLEARRYRHPGQSRQSQGRRRARGDRGPGAALVYLPPYSPDLNPIEQAFAKLKTLLRKLAARTVSGLWDALGDLLDRFTPRNVPTILPAPDMFHSIGIRSKIVIMGTIGDGRVAQRQRSRREDRGRRAGIALAGEDVENDVGGMNAVGDRLGAGSLDCRQPVGEHRGEDVDHLPIAVVGAGELAPHALHRGRQHPVLEGSAVAQGARLAGEHRHVVPWVVDCVAAAERATCSATIRPSWRITMRSA